jgi:hypothetical protein
MSICCYMAAIDQLWQNTCSTRRFSHEPWSSTCIANLVLRKCILAWENSCDCLVLVFVGACSHVWFSELSFRCAILDNLLQTWER